jgi:hypothetical protein
MNRVTWAFLAIIPLFFTALCLIRRQYIFFGFESTIGNPVFGLRFGQQVGGWRRAGGWDKHNK